jgi:thiol-disulfide isomerase/thioredoxin
MIRSTRWLAAAGAMVALIGCAPESGDGGGGLPAPGRADIAVDTAELRELKREAGVEPCEPGRGNPVDGGLPEVTLPCLGGGEDVDVSTLRGPLVVNLWAVWCGPCRRELPIYQEFHERYADRVDVLGIDYQDAQPGAALELVRETGVTYPLLADPQTDLSRQEPLPNIQGLPFLALVDEEGVVTHQEFVEIRSLGQLEGLVEEHLGVDL